MAIVALAVALIAMATAASAAAQPRLGLAWSGSLTASEKWDTLKKSGATMYRIPIAAEKSAYGLDFAKYDEIFAFAADRGIRILPILVVKEDSSGPVPTGQFDWFEFVRRAVKRYGHNGNFWVSRAQAGLPVQPVEAWEIWNEPNQNGINASEYGQFLGGTAHVLQSASSNHAGKTTQVLMGGILMWNGSGQGYFQTAWNQVKNEGNVTGVAIHPYAMCGDRLAVMRSSVHNVRNYLNANLGNSRSIWITEFGWPLGHWVFKNQFGQTECEFTFREADQAGHMQAALDWYQAQSTTLNIPTVVWYNLRDDDQAHRWDTRIGLRDEAGHFRRAWYTFQSEAGAPRWPLPTLAFQANTSELFLLRNNSTQKTLYGMKSGTSPSVGLSKGGYTTLFQANTGELWGLTPPGGAGSYFYGMKEGTSPAIASLEGGSGAFHANTGTLFYFEPGKPAVNTGLEMAPGTSPSIASIPDLSFQRRGFVVAFQRSNGNLGYVWKDDSGHYSVVDTQFAMRPGTSPSVAAVNSPQRVAIAFQTNLSQLWVLEPGKPVLNTSYGMKAGTSPAITGLSDPLGPPFAVAFQANTGNLWFWEHGGVVGDTGYGMASGTSPSISSVTPGPPYYRAHQIAFHASNGSLWTYEAGGAVINTLYGFMPGTSPSISGG
ncbi:MAG: hypothetical protein M3335_01105 [Actinomycetota bacterium]|nr:hypothetical protein [Actinomycetota bacterium]